MEVLETPIKMTLAREVYANMSLNFDNPYVVVGGVCVNFSQKGIGQHLGLRNIENDEYYDLMLNPPYDESLETYARSHVRWHVRVSEKVEGG